jgi:DNA-binding MarR family transcriptional regulator
MAPAQQTPLDLDLDLAARMRLVIARLARQLRQQAGSGLSPSQHSALVTIEVAGPITLGELAVAEQVAPPTVTKVVAKLEDDGLVAREVDPADRRVVRVSATTEGRRRLDHSRSRRNAWLAKQLRALDPDEIRRLADAMDVLEKLSQQPQPPPSARRDQR